MAFVPFASWNSRSITHLANSLSRSSPMNSSDESINETAFRNSSLQAAYFILAARALGLDCGPMSGFDADKLNVAFFPDGRWKVNLLCNLGYGDPNKLHPRNPRLNFEEASVIL